MSIDVPLEIEAAGAKARLNPMFGEWRRFSGDGAWWCGSLDVRTSTLARSTVSAGRRIEEDPHTP